MKRILLTSIAAFTLAVPAAFAADYTVFRVCEDQHVIRTADGSEAGRVEYIVLEPSSQRIVSAVVKGGVLADRFVALPMTAFRFGGAREITLTNINREQLVSAPIFETSRLSAGAVIEPAIVERSYTHFGLNAAEVTRTSTSERSTTETSTERNPTTSAPGEAPANAGDRSRVREEGRTTTPDQGTPNRDPNRAERSNSAPGQTDTAPGRSGTTPGRSGATPGQSETAPGKTGTTPGRSDTAPGKAETTPGRSGTTPGKREEPSTPRENKAEAKETDTKKPDTNKSEPKSERTTPGQSGTTPGQGGTAPGKAGATPGKDDTAPGKNDTTPDATESPREKKERQ